MADDELTEDPYAEQQQHHSRKSTTKKRIRRRDDPLPMPLTSGPSSLSPQSFPSPPLPPPHSPVRAMMPPVSPQPGLDSDSDSLSDYEKIDDDVPQESSKGPRLTPGAPAVHELRLQGYPQPPKTSNVSLPGYPQPPQSSNVSLPSYPRPQPPQPPKVSLPGYPHSPVGHLENVAVVQPAQKQPVPAAEPSDEVRTDPTDF